MTLEQIKKYKYCEQHKHKIQGFKKSITHTPQMYGAGGASPNIEHDLENIHRDMHLRIMSVYEETEKAIDLIIEEI